MKKSIKLTILAVLALNLLPVLVRASGVEFETGTGLQDIVIPLFDSNWFGFVENASILSWLSFAGAVFTVLILAYWIVRILLSGIEAIRSEGDPVKLQESYGKLKSNFIGMAITFLIPLFLSLIGAFLGIGSIFQWPQSFQLCTNTEYRFYFEAYAKLGNTTEAETACGIN